MRLLATFLAGAAVTVAVVAPATQAAIGPKLRLVSQQPLVVRGVGFRPAERVVVTAITPAGPKRVAVRATATGRFNATLRLVDQPCGDAVAIRALGSRGSRAWLDVAARPCIPPPVD